MRKSRHIIIKTLILTMMQILIIYMFHSSVYNTSCNICLALIDLLLNTYILYNNYYGNDDSFLKIDMFIIIIIFEMFLNLSIYFHICYFIILTFIVIPCNLLFYIDVKIKKINEEKRPSCKCVIVFLKEDYIENDQIKIKGDELLQTVNESYTSFIVRNSKGMEFAVPKDIVLDVLTNKEIFLSKL